VDISFDMGREAVEPAPFAILALGDFGGRAAAGPPEPVTGDTLDAVMAARKVALDLAVPNLLGTRPATLDLRLTPRSLKDLTPAALLEAVPELAAARGLERAVADRAAGKPAPELADRLAACRAAPGLDRLVAAAERAAAPPRPASRAPGLKPEPVEAGGALDRLLGMVDTAGTAPASPAAPAPETARPGAAAAGEVTDLLARQVAAVLHDPAFQALEAAWRGLRLLLRHAGAGSGVTVRLLDLPREAWAGALGPGGAAETAEPALIVAEAAVGHGAADLERLQALAAGAEGLQAPLLLAADAAFFEVAGPQAGALPFLGTVLDGAAYDGWRSFRDKPAARWVGLAFNRLLLRAPYTADDRKSGGLDEPAPDAAARLWGNPAWAVAALAARSVARTGWPTELTGPEDGALAGLDLWPAAPDGGPEAQIPLEAALPEPVATDLAENGFLPLTCRPNRDSLYVLRAPSAARPMRYGDEAATAEGRAMARLPYTLLAARVADAVGRHRARHPEADPGRAAAGLEAFLRGLVGGTGPGAGAEARAVPGEPGAGAAVEVTVRTGPAVLGGATVHLAFPVGDA